MTQAHYTVTALYLDAEIAAAAAAGQWQIDHPEGA